MSTRTSIEWTEHTWNPTTGCTKVSAGCQHCYAETMARRLQAMGVVGYENGFSLALHPQRLRQPLERKRPTLYFVNSMSDLFHEQIPDSYIEDIFGVMRNAPQHRFQVLTKRAERMSEFLKSHGAPGNLWLGVTVENRRHGIPRVTLLREADAPIRFLSIEPLLEDVAEIDLTGIHWIIVGGESGGNARKMEPEWVLRLQAQSSRQNVAFFFKQWGTWGQDGMKRNKKANGRLLLGRTWDDLPTEAPQHFYAEKSCNAAKGSALSCPTSLRA